VRTQAGKKTYTLLMGKPRPAKLANFPEVEVFVMLADPQGHILDCRDYLAPLITPHEAFLAFTGAAFDPARYRLDFGDLLTPAARDADVEGRQQHQQQQQQQGGGTQQEVRQGWGGNITADDAGSGGDGDEEQLVAATSALVIAGGSGNGGLARGSSPGGKQVQVRSAAQYLLQQRTYRGLETPAVGADILPAARAVEGRVGRAAGYADEPSA
jgi:diphthamide biosynthesis protein 2